MLIPRRPGCYILTHVESGKFYIGSSGNLYERHHVHMSHLYNGIHKNLRLQELFDSDDYCLMEYQLADNREIAYQLEQTELDQWIDHPDCLNVLNDAKTGWKDGTYPLHLREQTALRNKTVHAGQTYRLGMKHTEETKSKISAAQLARDPSTYLNRPPISWETRSDRRTDRTERPARLGARGRVATDEQRSNMRTASIERGIKRSKGVCICGVDYHNAGYAAIAHNVTRRTIVQRIASDDPRWEEWKYA